MTREEAVNILINSFIMLPRCNSKSILCQAIDELIYSYADKQKGEWINKGYGEYKCSVCHGIVDFGDEEEANVLDMSIDGFRFCPRCGSDMRGE